MKRNAVLIALLAVVLADAAAAAPGFERLGSFAGGLAGRAASFLAVLAGLVALRSLAGSARGALAQRRVAQGAPDRVRGAGAGAPGMLRDGALNAGLD